MCHQKSSRQSAFTDNTSDLERLQGAYQVSPMDTVRNTVIQFDNQRSQTYFRLFSLLPSKIPQLGEEASRMYQRVILGDEHAILKID